MLFRIDIVKRFKLLYTYFINYECSDPRIYKVLSQIKPVTATENTEIAKSIIHDFTMDCGEDKVETDVKRLTELVYLVIPDGTVDRLNSFQTFYVTNVCNGRKPATKIKLQIKETKALDHLMLGTVSERDMIIIENAATKIAGIMQAECKSPGKSPQLLQPPQASTTKGSPGRLRRLGRWIASSFKRNKAIR